MYAAAEKSHTGSVMAATPVSGSLTVYCPLPVFSSWSAATSAPPWVMICRISDRLVVMETVAHDDCDDYERMRWGPRYWGFANL